MSDADWQRLSVRRGLREPDGPFEGIPDHLRAALREFVGQALTDVSGGFQGRMIQGFAAHLRINLTPGGSSWDHYEELLRAIDRDENLYLDVLDILCSSGAAALRNILEVGGSVWTVADDDQSLERRVAENERDALERATYVQDESTRELRQAWGSTYGRTPDPSDAWDHAIKAVEAMLIPIVAFKKAKATLANVAGQLKQNPNGWRINTVDGTNGSTLEAMVRSMWPNPDRHGGGNGSPPTLAQAEGVVGLAVLIVGWARRGLIEKS